MTAANLAARGSALTLAGTAAGAIANFAMIVLLGNVLDPVAFGVFAGATAAFQLGAVVLRFGADTAATWYVAGLVASDRTSTLRAVLRSAVTPVAVASTVVALVVVAVAPQLGRLLSDSEGADDFALLLRILAMAVPVATVGEVLMGATRGLGAMRPTVVSSQLGRQVGQFVAVTAVVTADGGLRAIAVAWALPYLVTVVYPLAWLRTRSSAGEMDAGQPRQFWAYSLPQGLNQTAQAGLEKFDIIALGVLLVPTAQGQYAVANRFAHVVVLAWFAVNLAQAPVYARLFASGADDEVRRVVRTVSSWAVLLVSPVLWLFVVHGEVVTRVFGPEYESSGAPLRILAVALLVSLLLGPAESLLLMSGRSMRAFANNVMALVLNVVLNLVLVPHHGIRGAAMAWLVAMVFTSSMAARQVRSERGVVAFGRPMGEAWLATALSVGGFGALIRVLWGTSVATLLLTAVVGGSLLTAVVVARRRVLGIDELVAAIRPLPDDPHLDAPSPPSTRPAWSVVHRDHLQLSVRSRVAVAVGSSRALRSEAVRSVQPGSWRGSLLRATVGRLYVWAPAPLASLVPRVTLTSGVSLAVDASVAAVALELAQTNLDRAVDEVVWLIPPPSDGVRAAALLYCDGEAIAHLRISSDLRRPRPDPSAPRGERSGVLWPEVLAVMDRDDIGVELTSIVSIGEHQPTFLDSGELEALVADIGDVLRREGDVGRGWPMHGDLTPWNLRSDRKGRRALFDWEHRGYGPVDVDLVRYVATAPDGVELFESLPAVRRAHAAEAVRWLQREQRARAARVPVSGIGTSWKRTDLARESARLDELAARAR